jgi:hypothetical protein
LFGTKRPGKVKRLRFDMSDRLLTYVLPKVSTRQHPIAGVEIAFRVDASLPWTVQTTIPAADPPQLLFVDVPAGEMFYRAVVIDAVGARGNDAIISATGAYDIPGSVTNFTATEQ